MPPSPSPFPTAKEKHRSPLDEQSSLRDHYPGRKERVPPSHLKKIFFLDPKFYGLTSQKKGFHLKEFKIFFLLLFSYSPVCFKALL